MARRSEAPAPSTLRTQIGPFAVMPYWVLTACADARALQLYLVLARYANRDGRAWPSREQLMAELVVSGRSLDRALQTLKEIGAVTVTLRHRADGAVVGVDYLIVQAPPDPSRVRHSATDGEKDETPDEITPEIEGQNPLFATGDEKATDEVHFATDGEKDTEPFRQIQQAFSPPVAIAYKEELDPDNQIQEQERVHATPPSRALTAPPIASDPCADFVALWNATVSPPIARVLQLTPRRRRWIRARLAERPLAAWRPILATIAASDFCRGAKGWVVSFDWVIKSPDPGIQALEGQFVDHAPPRPRPVPVGAVSPVWTCPHTPACLGRNACHIKQQIATARQAQAAEA